MTKKPKHSSLLFTCMSSRLQDTDNGVRQPAWALLKSHCRKQKVVFFFFKTEDTELNTKCKP